jgi:Na+-translocating ferredoxin:NAD+ oxidoreductase RnfC subunit
MPLWMSDNRLQVELEQLTQKGIVGVYRNALEEVFQSRAQLKTAKETLEHLARNDYNCDNTNICEASMFAATALEALKD